MIIDTDQIASSIKRYKAQLRYYKNKIDNGDPLVQIEINKAYVVDVGIEFSLVEIMDAQSIVESVNRSGSNWAKAAFCAVPLLPVNVDDEKAEQILDICYKNLDEDIKEDDFFDIDCEF